MDALAALCQVNFDVAEIVCSPDMWDVGYTEVLYNVVLLATGNTSHLFSVLEYMCLLSQLQE